MPHKPDSPLTPSQLEIMREVWQRGQCSVTELWKALEGRRDWARNTVLTLVQRLEQRGWLRSEPRGRGRVYRASIGRDEARRHHLDEVVQHVFDGSAEALVRSLLGHEGVDAAELARLRRLIDEAERQRGRS